MACLFCKDGLIPIEWTDAPAGDIAICLCAEGQVYRKATNEGRQTVPLWRVWCAIHQVDPSRVYLMEAIWSAEELAQVGLLERRAEDREALLLAAARRKG